LTPALSFLITPLLAFLNTRRRGISTTAALPRLRRVLPARREGVPALPLPVEAPGGRRAVSDTIVLLWGILALSAIPIAEARGRSGGVWFLVALVISPILAIILLLASDRPRKRCPDCDELAQHAARLCPHCRHEFAEVK
jgi:hypothetical protein